MPWHEVTTLTLRYEFVMLAQSESCNFSSLCDRFSISRKTGYKWLKRYKQSGGAGLTDLSRRPHFSPLSTDAAIEDAVIDAREKFPAWGGRKLHTILVNQGCEGVPAPSTITAILRRNGKLDPAEAAKHTAFERFEHPHPNDLWQMDFKGHFPMRQGRCHPLTVLDDHSRYSVLLKACAHENTESVQQALTDAFRRYGLPYRMNMDNGSPWGNHGSKDLTVLTVWLMRLGIAVSHSRPYHPQTNGKDERFHRTLNLEAIKGRNFHDLADCQQAFEQFRHCYNFVRPHESLQMKTPGTRYQSSARSYPESLPPIEYPPGDEVRKVQGKGEFFFKGRVFRAPKALSGYPIALRPTGEDGVYSVHFCHQKLKLVSLRQDEDDSKSVTHVPEQL